MRLEDLHLIEKNWFKPEIRIVKRMPITQVLKVLTGIVGSSVLATAARTSA